MTETSTARDEVAGPSLLRDPKRLGRAVLGVVFLAIFIGYFLEANGMDSGTLHRPGAGMYPFWIGLAGIAISVVVIVESAATRADSGKIDYPKGRDLRNTLIFVGMLLVFILVLPVLGMYISATLFALVFLKVIGEVSWMRTVIIGLIMGLGVTYCFDELLSLPLPSGSLL